MENEEILKKAIEKAVKNGYQHNYIEAGYVFEDNNGTENGSMWCWGINNGREYQVSEIIFSHDFAKAFWGRCPYYHLRYHGNQKPRIIKEWQYRLQQIVLEEEPLKYLEKFI